MANPERGEVPLTVTRDGIEKTYTLKLSMNAAVTVEARTKRTIGQLVKAAEQMEFLAIRELLFVLLQKYHAKEFTTPEKVGDLIDDVGVETFHEAFRDLARVNQPDTAATGGVENPPKAPSGSGDGSTLTPAA